MYSTLTIILSTLVGMNFLLLIFSCNKSSKQDNNIIEQPIRIIKAERTTNQSVSAQLASTGS